MHLLVYSLAVTPMPRLVFPPQALDLGLRLGAAFRSPSGVPYSDVNLRVRMLLAHVYDRNRPACCQHRPLKVLTVKQNNAVRSSVQQCVGLSYAA